MLCSAGGTSSTHLLVAVTVACGAVRSSCLVLITITRRFLLDNAMISLKDILRELEAWWGGLQLQLVPFYKSVCVYLLLAAAGCAGGGEEPERAPSATALCAKCAPVLCLLAAVALHLPRLPTHQGAYARRVCWGLGLSAVGDAVLAWPGAGALQAGMGAFGAAHVAYLRAFGFRPARVWLGVACLAGAVVYVRAVWRGARGTLAVLLPPYAALLACMAWRGAARGGPAACGALLFLLSDAMLGYALFGGRLPCRQVLVMSTYYLGQLGIAMSALQASPREPAEVRSQPIERHAS